MAQLLDPRWYAHDDDGNPLVGATLTIYTANTVTPAAVWRDAALSVPMTNPSSGADVSNAAGVFPQVFAADGLIFDILLKDADGNLVRSYVDVTPAGGDAGDFDRTLADDTRLKFTGSGGRVLMQAGDPDPDDIGGKLTIEGWGGTQLDDLLIDAALTDTTGTLKEKGARLIGTVASPATPLAAATTNVIPLPNDPAGCRAWRVDFFDMTSSAATVITLSVQLSFDGGATYKETNEYDYENYGRDASGSFADAVGTAAALGQIANGLRGNANKLIWGTLEILSPLSGTSSNATIIDATVRGWNQEGAPRAVTQSSVAYCQSASQGRPTHVKLLANSGNIDCKYRVVPYRGFGET